MLNIDIEAHALTFLLIIAYPFMVFFSDTHRFIHKLISIVLAELTMIAVFDPFNMRFDIWMGIIPAILLGIHQTYLHYFVDHKA